MLKINGLNLSIVHSKKSPGLRLVIFIIYLLAQQPQTDITFSVVVFHFPFHFPKGWEQVFGHVAAASL
jgi:hypothetical protein